MRSRTKIISLVVIVVVLVVATVALYPRGSSSSGSTGCIVTEFGTLTLRNSEGSNATLSLTVHDCGPRSITGISFGCRPSQFAVPSCTGLVAFYDGKPVSAANPLPANQNATASGLMLPASGTTFTVGMGYTLEINSTFSTGSTVSQTYVLTAES